MKGCCHPTVNSSFLLIFQLHAGELSYPRAWIPRQIQGTQNFIDAPVYIYIHFVRGGQNF